MRGYGTCLKNLCLRAKHNSNWKCFNHNLTVNIYPISRELKDSFREIGYKSSCVFQIIFNVRSAPFTHTHPWVPDDGGLVVGLWFAHVTLLVTTQGLSLQCIAIYPHNSWSCWAVKRNCTRLLQIVYDKEFYICNAQTKLTCLFEQGDSRSRM